MKIRMGFVSNSSSSSFCIYGMEMDKEDLLKIIGKTEEEFGGMYDSLEEAAEKTDLEMHGNENSETYYLGRSYSRIGGEETGNQFKADVVKKLSDALDRNVSASCSYISEAWYNG